jgi:hypothetical protein
MAADPPERSATGRGPDQGNFVFDDGLRRVLIRDARFVRATIGSGMAAGGTWSLPVGTAVSSTPAGISSSSVLSRVRLPSRPMMA